MPNNTTIITSNRSEINDLIGNPPNWLLRSGIGMIALVTFSVLALASYIQYPDKIDGSGILTSDTPPIELISKANGYIDSLLVTQNDTLQQGQVLMYIQNTTDTKEITILSKWIEQYRKIEDPRKYLNLPFVKDLQLGTIQNEYASLQLEYGKLQQTLKDVMVFKKIKNIDREVAKIKQLNTSLAKEKTIYNQELQLTLKDHNRNQSLATDKVISQLDLEKSKTTLLQKERAYEGMSNTIIQNEIRMEQLKLEQLNLQQDRSTLLQTYQYNIDNIIARINANMANWNETYTITSPIAGVIQYQSDLHNKSAIQQGELIGYVLPTESNQLRITAKIPIASAGKVEVGQRSIIRFDAFPSKEYGVVIDALDAISQLPIVDDQGERWYTVEYVLDNPITTDYGEDIPIRPDMSVEVEVITESKSLLERVFNQLVDLVRKS